jgi:hypothetical protein
MNEVVLIVLTSVTEQKWIKSNKYAVLGKCNFLVLKQMVHIATSV